MQPHQARLVTATQQLLALGVVLALLTPAAGIVSLDVVPGGAAPHGGLVGAATVPTRPVTPQVTEIPLTDGSGRTGTLAGRTVLGRSVTAAHLQSRPQRVDGFGTVGVTWAHGAELEEDDITVAVRTRADGAWGKWTELDYHDEHAPDPASAEAAHARPGTEPLVVGDVDDVQVRADAAAGLPADLSLAVIEPGSSAGAQQEEPEAGGTLDPDALYEQQGDRGAIAMRAAVAAQPTIYSRAQWGADESMRDPSSLRYGSISAGFVHHTVNGNDYTEAEVPGIIRSIYAYHVRSRGWSDIGYNFLVDKFGRIWEGRYGGIDKPVVGAHTLGYNQYAFAMSAIGNFETAQPTDAMLRSYGALFGWKLGLHGVDPMSSAQQVGKSTFAAINGHRDAGSTACPGKYLYAQIPLIRQYAASAVPPPPPEVTITEPHLQTNLVGTPYPDLVVRRASDGQAFVIPTGGLSSFTSRKTVSKKGWQDRVEVLASPDLTGDGLVDLASTTRAGILKVRPGTPSGKFAETSKVVRSTREHDLLAAAGDLNRDGRNDLAARRKGSLVLFLGAPKGGFKRVVVSKGINGYKQLVGPGDVTGDGNPDLLGRDGKGRLRLHAGDGAGGFAKRRPVPGEWGAWNRLAGGGDYTVDGRADLVARDAKGKVFILPGRGDGSFGLPLGPAANLKSLRSMTGAGNVLGDAAPDLVGVKDNSLVVAPNRGTYDLGTPIDTGASLAGDTLVLNVGDWDRDGLGDVVTRNSAGELVLRRGNGQGQLVSATTIGTGFGAIADLRAVGDVTGDGLPDLLGTPPGGALHVYAGTGSAIASGQLVDLNKSNVQGRAGLPVDLSPYDWVIGVGDMRLSGSGDYVVRQRDTGLLYLYNGKASGTSAPRFLGEGLGVYDLGG